MDRRHTLRILTALGTALAALTVSVTPAAAFYETVHSGTTGDYQIVEPGVVCRYENNAGATDDELNVIKIKRFLVHGPFIPQDTKIGVRFVFQRDLPPYDGNFVQYAATPFIFKFGDGNEDPVYYSRTYQVPENTTARWRVRVLINWYGMDGTTIIGRVRGLFEVYRHKNSDGSVPYNIGTESAGADIGYCRKEFH